MDLKAQIKLGNDIQEMYDRGFIRNMRETIYKEYIRVILKNCTTPNTLLAMIPKVKDERWRPDYYKYSMYCRI